MVMEQAQKNVVVRLNLELRPEVFEIGIQHDIPESLNPCIQNRSASHHRQSQTCLHENGLHDRISAEYVRLQTPPRRSQRSAKAQSNATCINIRSTSNARSRAA